MTQLLLSYCLSRAIIEKRRREKKQREKNRRMRFPKKTRTRLSKERTYALISFTLVS